MESHWKQHSVFPTGLIYPLYLIICDILSMSWLWVTYSVSVYILSPPVWHGSVCYFQAFKSIKSKTKKCHKHVFAYGQTESILLSCFVLMFHKFKVKVEIKIKSKDHLQPSMLADGAIYGAVCNNLCILLRLTIQEIQLFCCFYSQGNA